MRFKPMSTILLAGFLVSPFALADDEFYCGTHIITEGLTKEQVLERCGEPAKKTPDQWLYERGPSELDILLYFGGGNVVESIAEEAERGR